MGGPCPLARASTFDVGRTLLCAPVSHRKHRPESSSRMNSSLPARPTLMAAAERRPWRFPSPGRVSVPCGYRRCNSDVGHWWRKRWSRKERSHEVLLTSEEELISLCSQRTARNSCQLTLDPNTANRQLSLSVGNRKVTCGEKEQPYPDHPERFDHWPQVLCRESLTGHCYWEAEWCGGGALIGVTYKGIRRNVVSADCGLGHNNKSWTLFCSPCSYSVQHNNKRTDIPVQPSGSHRVGVYLDWKAGALSFYRVTTGGLTLLHRFTYSFTEPLYPGFRIYPNSSVSLCLLG
nr:stonustoxin subunit beta-like [Paramormyrops kingsleyae]